jgi:hypothetical protein
MCNPFVGRSCFKLKGVSRRAMSVVVSTTLAVSGMVFSSLMAAGISTDSSAKHYVLKLALDEFSILNVSEMDGLLKYGGSGDFQLKMAKEGDNVVWIVTIDNPRLMELLGIFLGERTIRLVQNIDAKNLDPNQKIALEAIKSLSQKLELAQKNPLWDSLKLSGTVLQQGTNWMLQTEDQLFKLTGDKLAEVKCLSGRAIVADGFVKNPGEFDVSHIVEKRENTLEIFVMSFCPFGQRAEAKLLAFLAQTNANHKPCLDIHYIFYKHQRDGNEIFSSMHGEDEVVEDLVQMAIRDQYPQLFQPYLQLRTGSGRTPWKKLVEQLGIGPADEGAIADIITTQRDQMIRAEYEYASGRYEITDGSPSYVWESERVPDLKNIAIFKGLEAVSVETCSN